ncbi:DNA mismatch repair protein MutS, partial [ANME-1 cluster archaeon AG-394-G06]|nr:DNA mismatch repair protein MutS [ANME-1 cluster archaeon AG-394-G06]
YVHERIKAKTLFATHFYELTELADSLDSTKCFNVSIKEVADEIFFVRKVVEGRGTKSYGIQVAKLAGLPEEVIESAKSMLIRMEREVEKESERKDEGERGVKKAEVKTEYVVQTHPVVEELRAINLEKISPLEALNKLYELRKKI